MLPFLLIVALLTVPFATAEAQVDPVRTGAQMLVDNDFEALDGKQVGLVVNHTARVGPNDHLIDRIDEADNVELGALFGPEHGVRGTADAGEVVEDDRDPDTGVPIYSLYGERERPDPDMIRDLDALVFDIQDVGARFYTYISTMGRAMQSAAEVDVPFYVLDRPNPLGGEYVSGFMLDPEYRSFVGLYDIPVVHGMTVGELARMIKGEALLPELDELDLTVVLASGWTRDMRWPETELEWIAPSPNLPDLETALVYAGTCFFEAVEASEGRGTYRPFVQLGAPWNGDTANALADNLDAHNLPGVEFQATSFTPESIENMASEPRFEGTTVHGIEIEVTDVTAFRPVETGVYVLHAFHQHAQQHNAEFLTNSDWLAQLSGTDRLETMLRNGVSPDAIIETWESDVEAFRNQREPYLLYGSR